MKPIIKLIIAVLLLLCLADDNIAHVVPSVALSWYRC